MKSKYLRRYTDIPALVYLLSERTITLLDPRSWDDGNDSYFMSLYRERKALKSVLALCFAQSDETYHHWRVFAGPNSSGVCIRFKRMPLLRALSDQAGIRKHAVTYLKIGEIETADIAVDDLPFLKRYAYEHEDEFRVIYESKLLTKTKIDISIPLRCIERVTLSPWMHPDLAPRIKRMLRSIRGCTGLKIVRSTLIGNERWKRLGASAR